MADVHAGELELELEQEFHEGGGEAGLIWPGSSESEHLFPSTSDTQPSS